MVTLDNVRTQISDQPQLWPTAPEPPELLGIADGVQTVFALRYTNYIAASLTIFEATEPSPGSGSLPIFTAIAANLYTADEGGGITFATAPAAAQLIGARYQAVAFTDADLTGYLQRAQTVQFDDISVLKRVQYDIIDVVLMDYNRLYLLAQGEYRTDASAYAAALKQLKAELRQDLFGGPVAGAAGATPCSGESAADIATAFIE